MEENGGSETLVHPDGTRRAFIEEGADERGEYLLVRSVVPPGGYTLWHLAVEEVRQMTIGGAVTNRQVEEIRRVPELREDLPNTVMLHAHDHTDYQFDLIEPSLADGGFSPEERREIEDYEAGVFGDDWSLLPGNTPHFVPADDESTGRVGFR